MINLIIFTNLDNELRLSLLIILPALLLSCIEFSSSNVDTISEPETILSYVDPFIGTGGSGHTFPGATTPFGMVQCSPQTRLAGPGGSSGYQYGDTTLYGFAHTALSGTGPSDYGDILVLPIHEGESLQSNEDGQAYVTFQKHNEFAGAGWYSVILDNGVEVNLTATPRVGVHQYRYKYGQSAAVILDLRHRDEVLDYDFRRHDAYTVVGHRISSSWAEEQHIYFAIRSSRLFELTTDLDDPMKARVSFDLGADSEVLLQVAISAVDVNGALRNLSEEAEGKSFDMLRLESRLHWTAELGKVQLQTDHLDRARTFYTALYHSFLAPNLFNDVDGRYRGMDGTIHKITEHRSHYTVFSLWDTYRATHPLFTLLQPERNKEFIQTLLDHYRKGGSLPIWELAGNYTGHMIGNHAIPVIWDAFQKEIRGYDAELALKAMKQSASREWRGLSQYMSEGFVSAENETESVSRTLEYAYNDWCVAQLAGRLGAEEDYEEYTKRSLNWRNVYNQTTDHMRARRNGGWFKPFDPFEVNYNYTGANAWQYRFQVPHDMEGLIDEMGGDEAFVAALDELFTAPKETIGRDIPEISGMIGQYAHGNEPSHSFAYLYAYAGQAWKTQEMVRRIMDELYQAGPFGLVGNDDCGQLSSWLVFSAMGFYPVCPGDGRYVIGTPWFDEMIITMDIGSYLIIHSEGGTGKHRYVKSVKLNGLDHPFAYLSHVDLMAGASIEFEMGSRPNMDFGRLDQHRPSSEVKADFLRAPILTNAVTEFSGGHSLEIESLDEDTQIMYVLRFDDEKEEGPVLVKQYRNPIDINRSGEIEFWTLRGEESSPRVTSRFQRIP